MEEKDLQEITEEQQASTYEPRPVWQRVLAWIGVGIMIVGVILYYYHIARGGM